MLRFTRRFVADWVFLFRDIPIESLRLFLFTYLAFCFLSLLVISKPETNVIDRKVTEWVQTSQSIHNYWIQQATKLGSNEWIKQGCAISVLILLLLRKWEYVSILLIGIGGEMLMIPWLQNLFSRQRPDFPEGPHISGFGYPSGHTANATVFFGFWILFCLIENKSKLWTQVTAFVGGVAILMVGASRVLLLAHWTTDVLAGLFFAIPWTLFSFWISRKMNSISSPSPVSVKSKL